MKQLVIFVILFVVGRTTIEVVEKDKANPFQLFHMSSSVTITDVDKWSSIIDSACRIHNVDPLLVKAVIYRESRGDPNAVSYKGAKGLMQLMPKTAESLGVINPFDPTENVMGGTKYLKKLLKRYRGSEELALAAYNAGPNAVNKYGGVPPYRETQEYVEAVLAMKNNNE